MKVNIEDVPQDGRFVFHVKERKFHVRVSSIPTEYGESFVMRVLDTEKNIVDFPSLGFSGYNLRALEQAISRSAGMILLTGPTGSGKTTTLYSIVHKLNSPELKICTLEDPIEYRLPYLAQSQIDENAGYTFAKGLRALLRQDPDIIMVGEIRDRETGEIAMQAALTGHIVLSTLHTNSSVESISRLVNMGMKPFMIAPALNTVIAQRLVRRVCTQCSYDAPLSQKEQESMYALLEDMKKYHALETAGLPPTVKAAQGCDYCSHTGYKGQTALVEVFVIDEDIKEMIMNGAFAGDLLEKARRKGMITMMESGLLQVIAGETTLSEVYRVASL
jgi:type IV pilus assembly protein PilB